MKNIEDKLRGLIWWVFILTIIVITLLIENLGGI